MLLHPDKNGGSRVYRRSAELCLFLAVLPVFVSPLTVLGQVGTGSAPGGFPTGAVQKDDPIRSFKTSPQDWPASGVSTQRGPDGTRGEIHYNIHVLGEVVSPGTYRLEPSVRVFDALNRAGGILPNGSHRSIQLRRNERSRWVDMVSFQLDGDLRQNPYLMENDVVYVPLKKGVIQIEGPVKRPGEYEITGPLTLERAIRLAGDFAVGRSLEEPIRVIRFEADGRRQIIDVPQNDPQVFRKLPIVKGDIVVIPHVLTKGKTFDYNVRSIPGGTVFFPTVNDSVYVVGAVQRPGPYPFQPSFHYQDYVGLAGPINLANVKRTKVLRADGKKRLAKKTSEINPGDTIIVPSRSVTFTNVLTVFNTLTNTFLTTITIREVIKGL